MSPLFMILYSLLVWVTSIDAQTGAPSSHPTMTFEPTSIPSRMPSFNPTGKPNTNYPSSAPILRPTCNPTSTSPTGQPSGEPTGEPTGQPTGVPTCPTSMPSTRQPTIPRTEYPTWTFSPTGQPIAYPTSEPSGQPSSAPTSIPTLTHYPSGQPTSVPTSIAPTGVYQTHKLSGFVHIDTPDNGFCQPLSMNLTVIFNDPLVVGRDAGYIGQWFTINLPGITNGVCIIASRGTNLTEVSIYDPNDIFILNYYDGNWENYYSDTFVRFELKKLPEVNKPYSILIDRRNGFKRSCLKDNQFTVQEYRPNDSFGTVGFLELTGYPDLVFGQCYPLLSKLEFRPKMQKFPTDIVITLTLASKLEVGDILRVFLPGFTNAGRYLSNFDKTRVSSNAGLEYLTTVDWNTHFNWTSHWFEGDPLTGYADTYVEFGVREVHFSTGNSRAIFPERNGELVLTIMRASQISALCGQHSNYSGFAFEVIGSVFNVSKTTFRYSDGIGLGCKAQNDCSGNGLCNYCASTCDCFDGFGSERDKVTAAEDTFASDCSSRTCPVGPAMRNAGEDLINPTSVHRLVECSNNGVCDRNKGECKCFKGFGGAACNKMDCPGSPSCNDRGQCLPQSLVARKAEALPLTSEVVSYTYVAGVSSATWDANFGRMCVCDSSWKVGLGSNETQQPEYFGPACEYRRCPSGDNPYTSSIDETDCTGKSMYSTGSVGATGNKCHVDCSNLGTCNYNTGICTCYPGWAGVNCGIRITNKV